MKKQIKLKELLTEKYSFERSFGEPLPTLEDTTKAKLQEKLPKLAPAPMKSAMRHIVKELNKVYGPKSVKDYFVTPKIKPDGGGYQIYTIQMAKELSERTDEMVTWLISVFKHFFKGSYRGSYDKKKRQFNIASRE